MLVDADPKVSATVIRDQLELTRELHGGAVVDEAVAALAPPLREEIEQLLPGTWISTESARAVKTGIARLLGEDELAFQRRIVQKGIERTLNTVWRFFMRQLGDQALAKRTPVLYSRTFNRGSLELTRFGDGEYDLELEGWPRIPEFDLVGLMAGVETVLALAGRKEPRVRATRRPTVVTLHATWRR